MTDSATRPGQGLAIAALFGVVVGIAFGIACIALGVGGSGPESGLWLILMPMIGAVEGLFAGLAASACSRLRPTPVRVGVSAAIAVAICIAVGRWAFDGFALLSVEVGQQVVLGLGVAAFWNRWIAVHPRRGPSSNRH